ncbi:hypothetical protein CCAX7_57110 [Capsulimonas corticalis]|uniref:Uncharacterized protein n=1 Tax=Capsulimonas corticalis TaxID=2219043 RepID=A0A402D0B7_9BACT|nr:hypothetical protein [Capsulimonas corticalis]BDI33660.1 hypothetical protein CCAX7_57110 [Capsulimonas corticalis]
MKQIIIDLIAYCEDWRLPDEDRYFPDVVLSAIGRWGDERVNSAAHAVVICLSWDRRGHKKDRFGKMRIPQESDFSKMVRQWVIETPELAELFEVREDDIYLRDDLPSQEVDDMAACAHESMLRNVHVRPM